MEGISVAAFRVAGYHVVPKYSRAVAIKMYTYTQFIYC